MDLLPVLPSAFLLVVGAAVGFVPTIFNERLKERRALRSRWDVPLYELCKEYVSTLRQFVHLCSSSRIGPVNATAWAELEQLHRRLRGISKQLFLLANQELQSSTRRLEQHAYWVRQVAEGNEDLRKAAFKNVEPRDRLDTELTTFYAAARRQLGVRDAEDVEPDPSITARVARVQAAAMGQPQPERGTVE